MINILIWSKDRAAQLDILLRSWYEKLSIPAYLTVIYKASNQEYEVGYNLLKQSYKQVVFVNQNDHSLTSLTLDFLRDNKEKYVGFSTDDMFIYRPFNLSGETLDEVFKISDVFSLRLGFNTLMQDCHRKIYQPALNNLVYNNGEIIGWRWTDYQPLHNYGYPGALDLHIFPSQLMRLMANNDFTTTNELETSLFQQRYAFRPFLFSPKNSVAVNVPINNISNVTISGQIFSYSLEELNTKFIAGQRFTYEFEESEIIGCHQELKLKSITS